MMFSYGAPVMPGHNRVQLYGGPWDGDVREVTPLVDGSWPVIARANPDAIYVYREATGRYEHEQPAVR